MLQYRFGASVEVVKRRCLARVRLERGDLASQPRANVDYVLALGAVGMTCSSASQ